MSHSPSRIAVALILSCALLGGYASMFTSYHHGMLNALRVCTSDSPSSRGECVLDMSHSPASVRTHYTHIPTIDSLIDLLLEFFAQGLKSQPNVENVDVEAFLAFTYMAAQFGGAWYLMTLEGFRMANAGTILTWTGSFGIIFQLVTITIIAPMYLSLQILLSPVASPPSAFLVDPVDLTLLPISTMIAFVLPTVALSLPLLGMLSPEANYVCIALWQPFPLYQTAVHALLRLFWGNRRSKAHHAARFKAKRNRTATNRAYSFILYLTMGVHLLVFATVFTSAYTDILPAMSATEILAPTSLFDPPTRALLNPPVSVMSARTIVVSFLRWDVYCACASFVIWACYMLHSAQKSSSLGVTLARVAFWMVFGGPIAPAVMLLWERDTRALQSLEQLNEEKKGA
ncbi:hypothetical protein B0T10DRAFT_582956 [Thelonectria olida]|uniref:Uncharacterized protein n=1 Tax=Thelonectria olida TaxID=1576542 RepID=A0A9P8VXT8_9HYPO|nr:hypothetical protein B0T10DRAFT_582956 [Thelonectria olida]